MLGEPNRLSLVVCCLDSAQAAGPLTDRIGLSQSLVSHHLRLPRAARLLEAQRRGKQVFYDIADSHLRSMLINMTMDVTVEQVKCACADCVCIVNVSKGVERDGRLYCNETCSTHHRDGVGCQHAGCTCHG